ncbi:hypothetical protein DL768_005127 [Monosporascus sp. mg162]|nr:hypothetical protein DL768_005127 [Monosporascus sp. mg162]
MSLLQSFRNLTPRTRALVGAGLLVWGAVGLRLSDRAEERLGLTPSEEDREALARLGPGIIPVERGGRRGGAAGKED